MTTTNSVLGKGLGALIPNAIGSARNSWGPTIAPQSGEQIMELPVETIASNPYQPRKNFDQESLQELANSIKEHGIIQPLIVTQAGVERYQLVAGERRLKAAKLIGLSKVPAVVRKIEDQKKLEISLIENLQRHNLNPLEEAMSYRRLMDEFNLTQEECAQRVGRSRPTVANFLRILSLPKEILEAIVQEQITFSHAKAILSFETEKEQLRAFKKIIKEGLTVAETTQPRMKTQATEVAPDPVLASWEEKVSTRLGFRTRIKKIQRGGVVEISFLSDEDLKTLLDNLLR